MFYDPIINEETDGVEKVLSLLVEYDFTKNDWDEMVELYQWSDFKLPSIPTKTKSAFTRIYNKTSRFLPYSLASNSVGKAKVVDENFEDGEELVEEEDENTKEKDPMIKPVEKKMAKVKETKPARKSKTK